MLKIFVGAIMASLFVCAPVQARAPVKEKLEVKTSTRNYRVITYTDGSVRVTTTAMFGPTLGYKLREDMRLAVNMATKCEIVDDFWIGSNIMGTLKC